MSEPPDAAPRLLDDSLRAWLREASFVFLGRVREVGASNLDGVEADARMATVDVVEVVLAPNQLGDLHGQTVTVVAEEGGLEPDQELTFFARSWHYGTTIGVVEIGRTAAPVTDLRAELIAERLRQLDAEITDRIWRADAIVSGRVLATYPAEDTDGLPGVIDGVHWWNAELWVASVEKGAPPEDRRIWFPEGGDPEWSGLPKAYPEQTGVWLLHPLPDASRVPIRGVPSPDMSSPAPARPDRPNTARKETGDDVDDYMLRPRRLAALDPLDFHADSDLARIRTLIWMTTRG
jgi:hypothetical protein